MYIKVAVWRGASVHHSGCLAGCWCTSQWLFGGVLMYITVAVWRGASVHKSGFLAGC